jgi:hypothetical protein
MLDRLTPNKLILIASAAALVLAGIGAVLLRPTLPPGDGVVEGWAVLAEKDDYTGLGTSLMVDYINIEQIRQVLEESGWEGDHIREEREFDLETLQAGMDWLAANADGDDVVVLYITGHGTYLGKHLNWYDFGAEYWRQIPSSRRLLIIDACNAAKYTRVVRRDRIPYLAIASVDRDEYGWCGLENEGLPIIGGVFTHYFATAFGDPAADTDEDGYISAQEAAASAEANQRVYMHEYVFADERFLEDYHDLGSTPEEDPEYPHVVIDDSVGEPLYLALDAYR